MVLDNKKWYALSVSGGKEIKTKDWLLENKSRFDVNDDILDEILLPIQKKSILKNGKKVISESALMGPYIYVHADISNELVLNFFSQAPNVFSFVGSKKGGFHSGAAELNTEEIKKIMEKDSDENRDKSDSDFIEGESVCIIAGPFKSFTGTIEKVISKTNLLKVKVLIFGGETIIEVPFSQVKKKNNYE